MYEGYKVVVEMSPESKFNGVLGYLEKYLEKALP